MLSIRIETKIHGADRRRSSVQCPLEAFQKHLQAVCPFSSHIVKIGSIVTVSMLAFGSEHHCASVQPHTAASVTVDSLIFLLV